MASRPRAAAIKITPARRCHVCLNAWACEWIEEAIEATRKAGLKMPEMPGLYEAMESYYKDHKAKFKLEAPPSRGSVYNHIRIYNHSKAWNSWADE